MSNSYNHNFENPGNILPELQPIAEERQATVARAALRVAELIIPNGV